MPQEWHSCVQARNPWVEYIISIDLMAVAVLVFERHNVLSKSNIGYIMRFL